MVPQPEFIEPNAIKISIVCYGNIARSQILDKYLVCRLKKLGVCAEVFSCGTAPRQAYPNDAELLEDVHRKLFLRGLDVKLHRNWYNEKAAENIKASDIILVADKERKKNIIEWTQIDPSEIHLFYEYIGEGVKDFVDTYDYHQERQDPVAFEKCFDELERIANLIGKKIFLVK